MHMSVFFEKYSINFFLCFIYIASNAQITIPWSSSLNINFGRGLSNPGPPLTVGKSDFIYTTDLCPSVGQYTVVNTINCGYKKNLYRNAGITYNTDFQYAFPESDSGGYMMLVNAGVSPNPLIVFQDTVKNLCSNSGYLFWTGISNLNSNSCSHPNFTMNIETTNGQVIKTFLTGDLGMATVDTNHFAYYFGYSSLLFPAPKSTFPNFYGFFFTLPTGITDVVAKIILNPLNEYRDCTVQFAMDNVIIMPVSSQLQIQNPMYPDGWIIGACFQGNNPLVLDGSINYDSLIFGLTKFSGTAYPNPAFQWQQSTDGGYNWLDIPGETNINLSHQFNIPDTFLVRLRGSDASNINNPNCSVTSNIIKVEVDGLPQNYSFTSNSPVCEDSDVVLKLTGGASYTTFGPNGFFDNTALPHVYHPLLADSGWYYSYITSYGGCSVKDSTHVVIRGPNIMVGLSDSTCYGAPFQLSSSGGITYLWTPSTGLSDPNISDPVATPHITTKYTVKVTDTSGCSAFGIQKVILKDTLFKAVFNIPVYACPHDIIAIENSSVGKIESWNWDFGNGGISNSENPNTQTFLTSGNVKTNYEIRLIVTDSSGCSDTTYKALSSVPNCFIAVPSGFTPNGDGVNDYLYPLNLYKASNIRFRVFNRLGQLVFESHDMNSKWDGRINENEQPVGTYVWMLEYNDESNKKVSMKGTTVLIR